MIIYDDLRKNTKVIVYSNKTYILDKVANELEKEELKVEKYDEIEKIYEIVKKRKIKIIVAICNQKELIEIKNNISPNIVLISYIVENLNIEALKVELYYNLKIIEQQDKIDFEKYKISIVGDLVENISHQIQSNLLILSASQDIIKLISQDTKDKHKLEILDSLYMKNNNALDKSNMLLELMSNATSLSTESIMHSNDVKEIIFAILSETLKEENVYLNTTEKLKIGTYICGPLNDVIFAICGIIKNFILSGSKNIELNISEDESNWYFNIVPNEIKIEENSLSEIKKFIIYIKNVKPKINNDRISLIVRKVR